MWGLIARHTAIAICLAVVLEELGLPMPIPTDLLIVTAGATGSRTWTSFAWWFVVLSLASATGASGLYAIVRRGGRPLIERFGRYVHLGPKTLARGEALLARGGWAGIAVGRATPGLRLPTVVACGLLRVPYRTFITAHIAGTAVYILVFLALGRLVGPAILERLHLPRLGLRLLGLLVVAAGLPGLLAWWCARAHLARAAALVPSPRRLVGATLLAGIAGTAALAAAWAAAVTVARLVGAGAVPRTASTLAYRLPGWAERGGDALLAVYAGLLLGCALAAAVYYGALLPRLAARGHGARPSRSLIGQVLDLTLLAFVLVALAGAGLSLLRAGADEPPLGWPHGLALQLALAPGLLSYGVTVACGHALAMTFLPSRASRRRRAPRPTDQECSSGG